MIGLPVFHRRASFCFYWMKQRQLICSHFKHLSYGVLKTTNVWCSEDDRCASRRCNSCCHVNFLTKGTTRRTTARHDARRDRGQVTGDATARRLIHLSSLEHQLIHCTVYRPTRFNQTYVTVKSAEKQNTDFTT